MNKKKVLLVFGTRPEAIKMAPLVKELQQNTERFETIVCVTGQHREMLDQVLQLFDITPDYDLNIMKQGQDLFDVTSRVLLGMRDVLKEAKPDLVLVHGDTSTSTSTALAAFYSQIEVGHVEAGLRTHNLASPWPEEANRQLTARLTTYNFSPTDLSKENLLAEGIQPKSIYVTGNTVIDALYWVLKRIDTTQELQSDVLNALVVANKANCWNTKSLTTLTQQWANKKRKLVLITGHRRENFGQGFLNICEAIKQLATEHPEADFVYPMHLNPNVRKPITAVFGKELLEEGENIEQGNVYFTEPLEYLPFVYLMSKSYLVLTDSGGIQEEAPGLGKPVLVMRDTTERPEAVDAGTVKLVGTDADRIIAEVRDLLTNDANYEVMSRANNPYGDGKACERIAQFISE